MKFTLKPVEVVPIRHKGDYHEQDEIVDQFLELGIKYAQLSFDSKPSALFIQRLYRRILVRRKDEGDAVRIQRRSAPEVGIEYFMLNEGVES